MKFLIIILSLFISQPLMAMWSGTYLSTSQQGLAVEFNAHSEYLLYVIQDNQPTPIETGNVIFDAHYLNFSPVQNMTGQAQFTVAEITQDGCRFIWGEAGEFKSTRAECQNETQNTAINVLSSFSFNSNLMVIPQLGVPNATGGFDLYKITFQLIMAEPIQFQLMNVEPVINPINALSAVFYPQQQLLYMPVLAVDLGQGGQLVPIYELILQTASVEPFIMTEYKPYQSQAPVQDTLANASSAYSDPVLVNMMSDMNRMSHETSMSIISAMGGNCYGYSYECNN